MNKAWLLMALLAGAGVVHPTMAASDADVAELKNALAEMKRDYEARIKALEARVAATEAKAQARPEPAPTLVPAAPAAPVAQPAPSGGSSGSGPDLSLILQANAVSYQRDPEAWSAPGFQMGGESGLKPEGLSLTEAELTASATVDDWFYGQATLGVHDEDGEASVELEEAYIDTLSLPAGLGLRMGRFFSEIGYLNTRHPHAWDFADAPLTSQAFLGKQYGDDGVRLSWLAPTEVFLEAGVELLRGDGFPAATDGKDFLGGAHNAFVRIGHDVSVSHSFRVGLSHLHSEPIDRRAGDPHAGHSDEVFSFAGDSNLTVADLVWKWAPGGDARYRSFVFQTEYFHRHEDGLVTFTDDVGSADLPYAGTQRGLYVQGVYQFRPRWRAGLRYDRLWTDNTISVSGNTSGEADADVLDESNLVGGHDPWRWALMLDYSHSEFSRLRLQYVRDQVRPGEPDNQFFLQYIMTLGAHGAHRY